MINYAGIIKESIVDGEGMRYVIFVQGCPHHCNGCHNPETWDFVEKKSIDIDTVLREVGSDSLLQGITFSGGEPFCQVNELAKLARAIRKEFPFFDIWSFSGYTFEELYHDASKRPLLNEIDVLVDGRFILKERDISLRFRGSKNQRLIDVPKSLLMGEAVQWKPAR